MAGPYFFLPSEEVGHLATISVSSGTEDTSYPPSNLCAFSTGDLIANPAKVTGTAGDWLLDHGSATRIDLVVLWHNGDSGIDVRFKRGTTTSVTDINAGLTIPAKHNDGFTVKVFTDLTGVAGYNGATGFRYSKLVFPTNSVPPGAKLLCYSHIHTFEKANLLQTNVHRPKLRTSIEHRTEGGHAWVYDLQSPRRVLTGTLRLTNTDLAAVEQWFDDCAGHYAPTVFILDPAVNDALIGRIMNAPSTNPSASGGPTTAVVDLKLQAISTSRHLVDFGIEELTAGAPEWT